MEKISKGKLLAFGLIGITVLVIIILIIWNMTKSDDEEDNKKSSSSSSSRSSSRSMAELKTLKDKGNNPSDWGGGKLGECEGDCDGDEQCGPGLKCFRRDGKSNRTVPGCKLPSGSERQPIHHDYCVKENLWYQTKDD